MDEKIQREERKPRGKPVSAFSALATVDSH
jgi:hypothetical protein